MMTRKDYALIAEVIGKFQGELEHAHDVRTDGEMTSPYNDPAYAAVSDLGCKLRVAFEEANPSFNDDKFITAEVDTAAVRYHVLWKKHYDATHATI